MARYGTDHKEATRRRILDAAGRRIKQDGIDGAGIAGIMKDAGLTNGAFYAHFASKDDLVAAVVADQLAAQREGFRAAGPEGREGLEPLVRAYLSLRHGDALADGCPSAALLDEIGRSSDTIRRAYSDGLLDVVDDLAARLAPGSPRPDRADVLSALALLFGTLQLSRALVDRELAAELLDRSTRTALALIDDRDGWPPRPEDG